MTLYIVVAEEGGAWVDHPRLGPILVAAVKARALASERDADVAEFDEARAIFIHGGQDGMVHVRASVPASCIADAKQAVEGIYSAAVADGHEIFVRHAPEAETRHAFEADRDHHRGYVRFTLGTRKGEVHRAQTMPGAAVDLRYLPLSQK